MKKNKNMFYALTAILGASTIAAGVAVAGNPHDEYWYGAQPIEHVSQPEFKAPVATQNVYEQPQAVQYVYEEPIEQPAVDDGVPPADKDGSLFPGGSCKTCSKDKDGSILGGKPCEGCSKENAMQFMRISSG